MIDHVLGRPSVQFRKIQVLTVVSFWSFYLVSIPEPSAFTNSQPRRGNKHGPPKLRKLSRRLSQYLTPWQTLVITLLYLYIARNLGKLVGLECPEPLANLYTRSYFRATWVTTALDAGFWSAMRIRRKWVRDLASIVFTMYYLIAAEQADEKVRKVRGMLTVDHLRVSWNKGTTPYLSFLTNLMRPRFMRYPPRAIRIPRPSSSDYKEPVNGWLYFDGPLKGRCIGLSGEVVPKIVITGDSAGGNLAASTTLMIIESGSTDTRQYLGQAALPIPDGLILIYPGLDMNIGNWMSDEQMSLIKDRKSRKTNKSIIQRKSMQYTMAAGTPHQSDDEDANPKESSPTPSAAQPKSKTPPQAISLPSPQYSTAAPSLLSPSISKSQPPSTTPKPHPQTGSHHPEPLRTRLAMSSMISYFNDRILTPEMMRAMIILYIGPHNRPDFSSDYLLSPILAPDALLAKFPKTYFLTGERDPLVDDTVIFAGRLRRAKSEAWERERDEGGIEREAGFDEADVAEVVLIPGISHGFLQFAGVFPEGWKYIFRCGKWVEEIFKDGERKEKEQERRDGVWKREGRHHRRMRTESSGDEDMGLEMSISGKGVGSGVGIGKGEVRRRKERLLKEEIGRERERERERERAGKGRAAGGMRRQKSMVSLASEDDLLGRRMLGLVGSLTGRGDDGGADE
ncbi:Hormone-sensitive lipase protein [Rutstroemia sp. NJR-2017a BVV2]|nr:Hormone-sensitive lipase protein [Rutstroemia sp. NJR-2017a BVV2]